MNPSEEILPEPYCSLRELPYDSHSFFRNRSSIEELVKERQIDIIIEIGSWLGASTRTFAEIAEEKVYAIDTWEGSEEHQCDSRLPFLYQQFLSNMKFAGLCHKVVPIRMKSLEAASALNVKADLIYIDASHDVANVLSDIVAWSDHLNLGGIICGDDWDWPEVKQAVFLAAKHFNCAITSDEFLWKLEL